MPHRAFTGQYEPWSRCGDQHRVLKLPSSITTLMPGEPVSVTPMAACAAHRQHFMHVWLMKYTISLEGAGRRAKGRVWQERNLAERVSTGRLRNGLPGIITDDSLSEAITAPVEPEEGHRPTFLNQQFGADGTQSLASVNWAEVAAEGGSRQALAREKG